MFDIKEQKLAVLVDPDFQDSEYMQKLIYYANKNMIDYFFVGGSLISNNIADTVLFLKQQTSTKVILFPGSIYQITEHADAILLLSLISGRNPDFLIGNHVIAAQYLKQSGLKIIPTGYILVESGTTTSVEYISNTKPIPADKPDILISTALAGEMLGLHAIYLEAGSGAQRSIGNKMILQLKKNISIPLIVGGGIKDCLSFRSVMEGGANVIVVGTALERNPDLIINFYNILKNIDHDE